MNQKTLNYQESIDKIDQILEDLDKSNIPIDQLAERIEEAGLLLKYCKEVLTKAEIKIQNVLKELDQKIT